MLITKQELNNVLNNSEDNNLILIFIGMSGIGKTHWSKIISNKLGLKHYEVDHLIGISEEFSELIKNFPGKDVAEKVGNYFGKPWDPEFKEKEEKYLKIERKMMGQDFFPGTVLDLTGSSIYHPEVMDILKKKGMIIYLESSDEARQEMFQLYLSDPKPVCWNGDFKKEDNESNEDALKRCYPVLLTNRAKLYEKFADIKIPFDVHKNIKSPEDFIEEICRRLSD